MTDYLTREQAAAHAGLGIRTIDKYLRLGKLTAHRAEGRHRVFVSRTELDGLLAPKPVSKSA